MSEENKRRDPYVTTVIARGGRFEDLVKLLRDRCERSKILEFEESPFFVRADYSRTIYLRENSSDSSAELFDVYSYNPATNTHAFDQGLGWFLSCLLKTGYIVSACNEDPEKAGKASVDF